MLLSIYLFSLHFQSDRVHFSLTASDIQLPIYYHVFHGLMIKMFENHAFAIITFLHNCNLFQNQYFKPARTVTSQSKSECG